jgi:hypothetical protein
MKYRILQSKSNIEAIQWGGKKGFNLEGITVFPQWVSDALYGPGNPIDNPGTVWRFRDELHVGTGFEQMKVAEEGDWLIREENGTLDVIDNDTFTKFFNSCEDQEEIVTDQDTPLFSRVIDDNPFFQASHLAIQGKAIERMFRDTLKDIKEMADVCELPTCDDYNILLARIYDRVNLMLNFRLPDDYNSHLE